MNDTSREMEAVVAERYRRMSPHERVQIASSMFETARAIVESSIPSGLSRRERRLAFARGLYGGELPEAALLAFADWKGRRSSAKHSHSSSPRKARAHEAARGTHQTAFVRYRGMHAQQLATVQNAP